MHARSLTGVVPQANPAIDAMFEREFAEKAKFNLEQNAKSEALREGMKQSVAKYGQQSREVAQKLYEIKQSMAYVN